ncbi:hypothetical protein COE65_30795, partial [Bacillus sp. AFS051223]
PFHCITQCQFDTHIALQTDGAALLAQISSDARATAVTRAVTAGLNCMKILGSGAQHAHKKSVKVKKLCRVDK